MPTNPSPERFYWPHLALNTAWFYRRRPIAGIRALIRVSRRDFGEQCQECGRGYLLWFAPHDLWAAVQGTSDGTLCLRCFTRRAADIGLTLEWSPHLFPADAHLSVAAAPEPFGVL